MEEHNNMNKIQSSFKDLEDNLNEYIESHPSKYVQFTLEVTYEQKKYFMRIEGELGSKNCLVLYNGAVDLNKKEEPVFQRSSWVSDFNCLVINIDDPTVRLRKDLVLGWGQGVLDDYYSLNNHSILMKVYSFFNVTSMNRVHFGSSAGGYQAIVGSSLDKGSKAIVCNPQVDWTHHFFDSHVNRVREVCFKGFSLEALRSMYPERLNCIEMAKKIGNVPDIDYHVNSSFTHDMENQLVHFIKSISDCRAKDMLVDKSINIHINHNEVYGHNPPGKAETISLIKNGFID